MENKELKIAFYDACSYDKESFSEENKNFLFNIDFFDFHLTEKTALTASGYDIVCTFVNDTINRTVISILKKCGVKNIEDVQEFMKLVEELGKDNAKS